MLSILKDLTPLSSVILEQKRRFEGVYPPDLGFMSYEEILNLYMEDLTYAQIAQKLRCSLTHVRHLHDCWIAGVLPHQSDGFKRRRLRTIQRREKESHSLPKDSLLNHVASKAIDHGLSVTQFWHAGAFLSKTLLINGKRCAIRHLASAKRFSGESVSHYSALSVTEQTLMENRFLIIWQNPEGVNRIFVVPTLALRRADVPGDPKYFTIRVEELSARPSFAAKCKFNFFEYLETWDRLGPGSRTDLVA